MFLLSHSVNQNMIYLYFKLFISLLAKCYKILMSFIVKENSVDD